MFDLMHTRRRVLSVLAFAMLVQVLLVAAFCGTAFAQPVIPLAPATSSPLEEIVSLISAHGWLPLFALGLLYARKLCGPDSKFPITVPATWLPTVSAFFGLAYGAVSSIQNGTALGQALLSCVVLAGGSGFFDALCTAIFNHGAAPKWAQSLVFLIDDLSGGNTNTTTAGKVAKAVAVKVGAAALVLGLGGLLGGTVATQTGCTAQQGQTALNSVPVDAAFIACVSQSYAKEPAGTPILTVLEDGVVACGGTLLDVVNALDQKEPRAAHASVAHGSAQ